MGRPVRLQERRRQRVHIIGELHPFQVFRLIQLLVDEGHRLHAVLALGKKLRHVLVCQARRLQIEKTGDDLKVVLHTVVNLLQQHLLFTQRSTDALFGLNALRNIGSGDDEAVAQAIVTHNGCGAELDRDALAVF